MHRKRRFLLLSLDAAGNWPPERALIDALVSRGHDVRVASGETHAGEITRAGAIYRPYRCAPQRDLSARHEDTPESEMVRGLRDVFFNPIYADELLAQVKHETPEVLLVDQMLLAGAAAAESTGLPSAILWHTVFGAMQRSGRTMPAPLLAELNALRERLGVGRIEERWQSYASNDAILAFTYEQFDQNPPQSLDGLHYVGPLSCLPQPLPPYESRWPADDPRPLVLVSYSTSFQNQVRALQRVADALADVPARVLLTLGHAISADELRLPGNVVAEKFVPHAAVLPQARLVVTHAGHGTVMAAVTAGVPLVCVPMGRDQHVVAACVERNGLGIVTSVDATPEQLRKTIAAALNDEALLAAARGFAGGVDLAAGERRAIEVLENLEHRSP